VGSGDAEGFTVNLPVSGGTDGTGFRSLLDHVAVPLLEAFRPQLVLVSTGYDAHREDPLSTCRLTEDDYTAMTRSVRRACATAGVPLGFVLEGGYALEALARSVLATMRELTHPEALTPGPVPVLPLARDARDRLSRWWPALGG
jgi:acetoin utilization deacetylase AcuC-like enzyme